MCVCVCVCVRARAHAHVFSSSSVFVFFVFVDKWHGIQQAFTASFLIPCRSEEVMTEKKDWQYYFNRHLQCVRA